MEQAKGLLEKEKEYLFEKSLLDSLLNYVPDAIYFKDLNSKFIRASKSIEEFGNHVSSLEVIGKSDFDYYDKEVAEKFYKEEQKIIESGMGVESDIIEDKLPDGTVVYISSTKQPLKDVEGQIIGTMGLSRNVTKYINFKQNHKD